MSKRVRMTGRWMKYKCVSGLRSDEQTGTKQSECVGLVFAAGFPRGPA